ncbi:DedA family protein [uncultured Methanobacterium sp.]|uniref:DedA family protein n=1 Tax=uncultured Methanobacterium sp. TaxID=176306 RepID=UPI002AA814B6|nr:DedA family protein [uncultured Methanobacterium sp.]
MISIVEYIVNLAIHLIEILGYWGVFLGMTLESACIPLPSEIIMPFAGFVVYEGKMSLIGITIVGALGNLFGSLIAYFIGFKGGRPFLEKYGKYIFITHKRLEMADNWFEKYGHEAVLISRVLPIMRTFISLPAGIAHMDLKKFITYTFLGSLPWCFVLGYIGYQLGPRWDLIRGYFHILDVIVIMGIIGVLFYLLYRHYLHNKK